MSNIHIENVFLYQDEGTALAKYKKTDVVCVFDYDSEGNIRSLEVRSAETDKPIRLNKHDTFIAEASISKLIKERIYHDRRE